MYFPTVLFDTQGEPVDLAKGEPRRLQLKLNRALEEAHETAILEAPERKKEQQKQK